MASRIFLNVLIFLSILFFPWWITAFFALILLFSFEAAEVIIWGLLIDTLYGIPLAIFFHFTFVFTLLFMILFFVVQILKKRLVFY